MSGDDRPEVPDSIDGLAAVLTLGLFDATMDTTRQLYEAERDERLRAEAELALIRARMGALLSADFQPSTAALGRALYPSSQVISVHAAELRREEDRRAS